MRQFRPSVKGTAVGGADIDKLDLDSLAVKTAALLEPWEQQEQANARHEHDLSEIQAAVDKTRSFIADRPGELEAFVGPEESLVPFSPLAQGAAATTSAATFFVGHSRREAAALVTHLWLPGPGVVSQTATIETAHATSTRHALALDKTTACQGGRILAVVDLVALWATNSTRWISVLPRSRLDSTV
jgi:hypothetical protein